MNNLLMICTVLMFFSTTNGQTLQYASRFRNFSVESETGSAYLISSNIYQEKYDHKLSAVVNITKDIHLKNVEVVLYRCSFEKSDCENFQKWKFSRRLKSIVYMKNQMWSSIFDHITPKLDFPRIKKNIYQSTEMVIGTNVVFSFYPEVINYFWRVDATGNDPDDKKAVVMKFEAAFISFVKRDKTRVREGPQMQRKLSNETSDYIARNITSEMLNSTKTIGI